VLWPDNSMGLAGLRTTDNMAFFDTKKPLVVVYYEVDYERNPKGESLLPVNCLYFSIFSVRI